MMFPTPSYLYDVMYPSPDIVSTILPSLSYTYFFVPIASVSSDKRLFSLYFFVMVDNIVLYFYQNVYGQNPVY